MLPAGETLPAARHLGKGVAFVQPVLTTKAGAPYLALFWRDVGNLTNLDQSLVKLVPNFRKPFVENPRIIPTNLSL